MARSRSTTAPWATSRLAAERDRADGSRVRRTHSGCRAGSSCMGLNGAGFSADLKSIDALLPERPLLLWGADGHTGWANSVALKRAGITRDTADPAGGRIGRDRNGAPTGLLVDDAVDLVTNHLDKPTPEQRERVLVRALHDLAAVGITTFMEANTDAETVDTVRQPRPQEPAARTGHIRARQYRSRQRRRVLAPQGLAQARGVAATAARRRHQALRGRCHGVPVADRRDARALSGGERQTRQELWATVL